MKKGILDNLKEKPPHVRKMIAMTTSGIVAGFVAIFAIIGIVQDAKQGAELRAKTPIQKDGFFANAKKVFGGDSEGVNSTSSKTTVGDSATTTIEDIAPNTLPEGAASLEDYKIQTANTSTATSTATTTSVFSTSSAAKAAPKLKISSSTKQ